MKVTELQVKIHIESTIFSLFLLFSEIKEPGETKCLKAFQEVKYKQLPGNLYQKGKSHSQQSHSELADD